MPGAPDQAGDEWPGLCHRCGAVLTPGDDPATAVEVRELLE